MAQSNDARETSEIVKYPVTSMMFYGGLTVYALIIITAIVAIAIRVF